MEREIKFRAWFKGKQVRLYTKEARNSWHNPELAKEMIAKYDEEGLLENYPARMSKPFISKWVFSKREQYSLEEMLKNDLFVVMQFTGLHDKNGKEIYEIYEGDVYDIYERFDANSTDAGQLKYSNCEVVFDAGCFCFKIPVFPEGRVNTPMYFESGRTWDYKGNIYENPELLKP